MMQREFLHRRNLSVLIDEHTRFGQDALLLADFAPVWKRHRVLDLGTGCGILPLALCDAGFDGHCVAIELRENAAALAAHGVRENGLENHITVLHADLREYTSCRHFDVVLCNPPYFACGTGKQSQDSHARTARHETSCTLSDIVCAAARNLRDGGSFSLCLKPERLAELFSLLRSHHLEPKRLQLVKHTPSSSPWLALVDARFRRKTGLVVMPDRLTPSYLSNRETSNGKKV